MLQQKLNFTKNCDDENRILSLNLQYKTEKCRDRMVWNNNSFEFWVLSFMIGEVLSNTIQTVQIRKEKKNSNLRTGVE